MFLSHSFFMIGLVWLTVLTNPTAFGQEETTQPGLHYTLDVGFAYVDRNSRPSFSMIQPQEGVTESGEDGAHRSLGLTRLRLAIDWIAFAGADFHLVLRPDALNRAAGQDGEVREFDSRAGDLYRPRSTLLKPLDAYHLRFASGNSFASAIGVFENLAPAVGAYPSLLDFGLHVRMPAKYAGMEISWRNFNASSEPNVVETGVSVDLVAMHGDEDRVESFAYKPAAYDAAPEARDPYYGLGLRSRWIPTSAMTLGFMAATHDTQIDGGRKSDSLFQIYSEVIFDYLKVQPKLALEFRMAREKWRSDVLDIGAKVQQSISLTSSVRTGTKTWILFGAHLGRSDREKPGSPSEVVPADGHQVEAGILGKFDNQLSWQFLVNEERRELVDEDGNVHGGFINESGDRRTLRRMAFALHYLLDASGS